MAMVAVAPHARRRRNGRSGKPDCTRASRSMATSRRSSSTTARAAIARSMTRRAASRRGLPRRRAVGEAGPPTMIRSAWRVRRSACSTTTRFVATRARSRRPCSAARCRRGCPSPDTACSPTNGGSATTRSRSSRSGPSSGAPEGNPADLPKPPMFSSGWQLGTPDLVLTLPEPYVLQPGAATSSATSSFRCRSPRRATCAPSSSAPIVHRCCTTRIWRSI